MIIDCQTITVTSYRKNVPMYIICWDLQRVVFILILLAPECIRYSGQKYMFVFLLYLCFEVQWGGQKCLDLTTSWYHCVPILLCTSAYSCYCICVVVFGEVLFHAFHSNNNEFPWTTDVIFKKMQFPLYDSKDWFIR